TRMPIDVFPRLHVKAAVVATFYPGFAPTAMEQDITSRYERFFTLGSGIRHIESRSLPGVSMITVYFHSDVNLDAAAADLATLAMGDLGLMPPGTLPPLVLKYSATGATPVLLVTLTGDYGQTELQNMARYNVRNFMATVHGASVPYPFGGKIRQIMAYLHSESVQAMGLTPMDVVRSINLTNQQLPGGDAKIGPYDYYIYANDELPKPSQLDRVPIELGPGQAPVLFGTIGKAVESAQLQYNVVLINGKPATYIPVFRQTGANTIDVIDGVKKAVTHVTGLKAGMKVGAIYSQEGTILDAVHALEHEAISGAFLASLMILLFLGNFKSTFAIFLSIPLSILFGVLCLYSSSQTINIMTLGGFTLAIGRLIDDSTVVLENIDRHLADGQPPNEAARDGAQEVTYAVLAATISTVVVFLPVMFLYGVSKYLFTALALAVVFSMAASWVVSMTIIPLFCARYLTAADAGSEHGRAPQNQEEDGVSAGGGRDDGGRPNNGARGRNGWHPLIAFDRAYERFADRFALLLDRVLDHKAWLIVGVSIAFAGSMLLAGTLGQRLFPRTGGGKFIIAIRTPPGTRLELTERAGKQIYRIIHQVIPRKDVKTVVANLGVVANVSAVYTTNSGEDTGEVMVELSNRREHSTLYYEDRLRTALAIEMPQMETFFASGSIVDTVLNFGARAPITVELSAPISEPFPKMFAFAHTILGRLRALPQVRQAEIREVGNYPGLTINVDRTRAARLGINEREVVSNLITAINSNDMIAPSIWIDPVSGDDYYLSAQYFDNEINSFETLKNVPVGRRVGAGTMPVGMFNEADHVAKTGAGHEDAVLLRDVATIKRGTFPSEADHYDIQRVVDVLVSPRTTDLGGTYDAVRRVIGRLKLPTNVAIHYRGSIKTMES
ncbi:MAG TPA: efflux RND transporter permease subunit, partial [Candidatus Binataceae bacterium]|nr:efflux RND transporter permease subunit [Candidatus Binataceae bacterium]